MTIADVSNVGNVLATSGSVTGVVTMCALFIIYHMANQYTSMMDSYMSQFQYAVAGDLIALVLSQLAAAYAAVKMVDAVATVTTGFYYLQRGGSATGDFMGLYELFAGMGYLTWTLLISIVGYVAAGILFEEFRIREAGAALGLYGAAFGANDGFKYLALGTIIGGGAWIASVALGDSATELLGFFDNYNTKVEGTENNATSADTDGTSLMYDLIFHLVSLFAYFTVSSAIWLGGIIFGFVWMNPTEETNCLALDQSIKDKWEWIPQALAKQTKYDSCLLAVQGRLSDPVYHKTKGQQSRCENQYFLYAAGNSKDYATKYSRAYTLSELQQHICTQFKK